MGAWDDWDEVEKHLLGKPITMDISLSIELLGQERARAMLSAHPADRILFGTDSPWSSQSESLRMVRSLELDKEREQRLLSKNAEALLG
jgi:predicted TIM-barrel fold metal-dependent hydrolase